MFAGTSNLRQSPRGQTGSRSCALLTREKRNLVQMLERSFVLMIGYPHG